MSKWNDTIINPEDTFSDDDSYNRKPIKTHTPKYDIDTEFQALEDEIWKPIQELEVESTPEIRVFDVAAYILQKKGTLSTMKLQKLVYYSQAWSLVWDEKPLFKEDIEAWSNGPVIRDLFYYHRGRYEIDTVEIGNPRLLDEEQRETVDAVLNYYGDKSAQWLIELTHLEDPWIQAREGLHPLERGDKIIPLDAMADYYSSLPVEDQGVDA